MRILLVEDNELDVAIVERALSKSTSEFDLRVADSLNAAGVELADDGVDVILLDLNLPDVGGIGTIERIRQLAAEVPIVVLTGATKEDLALSSLRLGVQDYLVKGEDLAMLGRCLRYAIERHTMLGRQRELEHQLRTTKGEREAARHDLQRCEEFISVLSHELRNPIGAIAMGVEVLARTAGRDADTSTIDRLERQCGFASRLLDDLLDTARIARGRVQLSTKPLDLRTVVREAVESVSDRIAEHRLRLTVETGGQPLTVDGDATRLHQVVVNLVGNAIKYTPDGGSISVSTAREGKHARLRVSDDGIGMTKETLASIFEPFTQAPQSVARDAGGVGIGLALAKGLVELHEGTIVAHSEGLERGSEVEVSIPLCRPRSRGGESDARP